MAPNEENLDSASTSDEEQDTPSPQSDRRRDNKEKQHFENPPQRELFTPVGRLAQRRILQGPSQRASRDKADDIRGDASSSSSKRHKKPSTTSLSPAQDGWGFWGPSEQYRGAIGRNRDQN